MKTILSIVLLMTTLTSLGQNGKATTEKTTFSRTTSVSIVIEASPEIVWALLTNASDFARWNSTVVSIEGEIALGEKIKLKSTLDEKRTFKLKVKEFEINQRMVWADGQGKRTYTLQQKEDKVVFTMHEKIGGLMFPMYAKMIPPFDENFEQFAADLKQEAERIRKE